MSTATRVSVFTLFFAMVLGIPALEPATIRAHRSVAGDTPAAAVVVDCSALVVTGDPRSPTGATWSYQSTDDGERYVLEGVLFVPPGTGPFPAVVISHGKGGLPRGYSASIARTMVGWGLVAIGVMYTHAPDQEELGNEPDGGDGASQANVLRAHKARDLLNCAGNVDLTRVAAHGHSMGAFVTGQLLGEYPGDFRAASHTAGGVSIGPNATQRSAAERILTPYQLHHGTEDNVVALFQDQTLDEILTAGSVAHEFHIYPGYDHQEIAFDQGMLERVHNWYQANGVLAPVGGMLPTISRVKIKGSKKLYVYGENFNESSLIQLNGEILTPRSVLIDGASARLFFKGRLGLQAEGTNSVVVINPAGSSAAFVF
jgi:dienelactone hydrolase